MNTAAAKKTPAKQIKYIALGALEDVRRQPEVFRFYLNLFTQPKLDVKNPRQRSLYFSSTVR